MTCPRCRASMVENSYLPDGEMCNRCGLIVLYDEDGEISGTNETCGRTYILNGATGRATRGHTNCRYSFTPRSNYRLPKTTRSVLREAITGRT